jgi:spore maturation protein CgeB
MKIVVFGLTISSSWGNGHATLWRGLCSALGAAGHTVVFFERDLPYYAEHRDATRFPGCELVLYRSWSEIASAAHGQVGNADAALVTSYCPDSQLACELVLSACPGVRAFYDLDTPVTLERLEADDRPAYLPAGGLGDFDLVLSFSGGPTLQALRTRLGARAVAPIYGAVDPAVHHPVAAQDRFRSDLSYLGTYAADRKDRLEELFVEPARRTPERKFVLGGALYPSYFPWQPNVGWLPHVPPADHPAFFSSSGLSLNVTRASMARWGWCPSGRLFEAAACGAPQISDLWEGLEAFFDLGSELLVARTADDVTAAMALPRADRDRLARAARERVLSEHTATRRARELAALLSGDGTSRWDTARRAGDPASVEG